MKDEKNQWTVIDAKTDKEKSIKKTGHSKASKKNSQSQNNTCIKTNAPKKTSTSKSNHGKRMEIPKGSLNLLDFIVSPNPRALGNTKPAPKKGATPSEKATKHKSSSKTKQPSTLKKKILLNRQENWKKDQDQREDDSSLNQIKLLPCVGIVIENFIPSNEDIQEDEISDWILEIQENFKTFGVISSIFFPLLPLSFGLQTYAMGTFIIRYESRFAYERIIKEYHGKQIGGGIVQCNMLCWPQFQDLLYSTLSTIKEDIETPPIIVFNSRFLQVFHMILPDDLQDQDELDDTCSEIREIFEEYGPIEYVYVPQKNISNKIAVYIKFQFENDATKALVNMQNKIFGGRKIEIMQTIPLEIDKILNRTNDISSIEKAQLFISGYISKEDLENDDELEDVYKDAVYQFSEYGDFLSLKIHHGKNDEDVGILIEYPNLEEAKKFESRINEKVFGGKTIKARLIGMINTNITCNESIHIQNQIDLPKIGNWIKYPRVPNKKEVREYVDKPIDNEVAELVVQMLSKLMQYQERSRIKDPLKAKRRRRVVFGLKEVKRGIKTSQVIALIVAYNIEECAVDGGLDDTVQSIIDLANEKNICIIYSLSRRRLGKALGKTIRVSCVGIYNVDGVIDIYSKLRKTIEAQIQNNVDEIVQ